MIREAIIKFSRSKNDRWLSGGRNSLARLEIDARNLTRPSETDIRQRIAAASTYLGTVQKTTSAFPVSRSDLDPCAMRVPEEGLEPSRP